MARQVVHNTVASELAAFNRFLEGIESTGRYEDRLRHAARRQTYTIDQDSLISTANKQSRITSKWALKTALSFKSPYYKAWASVMATAMVQEAFDTGSVGFVTLHIPTAINFAKVRNEGHAAFGAFLHRTRDAEERSAIEAVMAELVRI